ncbi:MAG: methionine--tRNA ligase [Candidatus Omnitrophica bacterium]|nr:methionine--tRNA ligase [Candidatus Omnitrophota bacterium]MCF7887797.1 methionine--tRNA ligase [Candidatus Omnitrophota bacterium]
MKKFYLTSPIYYVNASPHIGHAYTNIICDSMARFRRIKGEDVFFLTGTDEHGEKIQKAANEEGVATKNFIDAKVDIFKQLWPKLNISYDFFVRTSWEKHIKVVKTVIEKLYKKGDIYKSKYNAFYCIGCETFWTKLQLNDGNTCPECGRKTEKIQEENYFFKLSKYESWFKEYLKNNPKLIQPKIRYNEVKGFLDNHPLTDLCISRPKKRISWGIELPIDQEYIVYVWFDALINYISGIGYGFDQEKFNSFWPADIHFIGKDILRHHAIFWPIMLKALDLEIPKSIFAHGWWKIKEEKISKSKGNIVNPFELVDQLTNLLGGDQALAADAFRYFLMREIPIGADGNFSFKALISRINSDLANDLGNLVYRTLNMAQKYNAGKIEAIKKDIPSEFKESLAKIEKYYDNFMIEGEFCKALDNLFELISIINKYIEDTKPWNLKKEQKEKELSYFLYTVCEGIRIISIYLYPIMPKTALSIQKQLGIEDISFSTQEAKWGNSDIFLTKKEKPLFPRIDVN